MLLCLHMPVMRGKLAKPDKTLCITQPNSAASHQLRMHIKIRCIYCLVTHTTKLDWLK